MSSEDRDKLKLQLMRHEGVRLTVYDDATGKALKPGMTLVGWPTIGTGRNLADPGISADEDAFLLENDIDKRIVALAAALPWFSDLDAVRQRVLVDMSFMGTAKLLKFTNTLAAIKRGDWEAAAKGMLASKWAKDVKGRAVTLAEMMRTGKEPL